MLVVKVLGLIFMLEIISDAFWDSLNIVPLLLTIYIVVELAEYKFEDVIITNVKKAGRAGPLIGALAGIFPQCGFSVIATALYTQKLVTIGTLLAVYLATSDEALPIILSQPGKIGAVFLLVMTKLAIALPAGYVVDFAFRKRNKNVLDHIANYSSGKDDKSHHHETTLEVSACCGHRVDLVRKFKPAEVLFHPIIHTLKIFLFIFAVTLAIDFSVDRIGSDAIENFFSINPTFRTLSYGFSIFAAIDL